MLLFYNSLVGNTTTQKMKFFIKDFFSKCDHIHSPSDLVTFTEEFLNWKLYFLPSVLIAVTRLLLIDISKFYLHHLTNKQITLMGFCRNMIRVIKVKYSLNVNTCCNCISNINIIRARILIRFSHNFLVERSAVKLLISIRSCWKKNFEVQANFSSNTKLVALFENRFRSLLFDVEKSRQCSEVAAIPWDHL